jgi:hypothetical protein
MYQSSTIFMPCTRSTASAPGVLTHRCRPQHEPPVPTILTTTRPDVNNPGELPPRAAPPSYLICLDNAGPPAPDERMLVLKYRLANDRGRAAVLRFSQTEVDASRVVEKTLMTVLEAGQGVAVGPQTT